MQKQRAPGLEPGCLPRNPDADTNSGKLLISLCLQKMGVMLSHSLARVLVKIRRVNACKMLRTLPTM